MPQLANASPHRRREWWRLTKQLQHGSLVCLWWDGDAQGSPDTPPDKQAAPVPNMMFATVCERDDKLLASIDPSKRPQLGLK